MRRVTRTASVALLLALTGCTAGSLTSGPSPAVTPPSVSAPPAPAPSASGAAPSPSTASPTPPAATRTPEAEPPDPVSVAALAQRTYDGRDLELGRELDDAGAYKRYLVSYRGDGLRITGVMNVPDGKGPFRCSC